MFKSKSFDLKNDESIKQPEHLYQPRKICWLKYVLIPLAIGFVLLMILINVDFSSDLEPKPKKRYSQILQYAEWCRMNYSTDESQYCNKNMTNLLLELASNITNNGPNCDNLILRIENYKFPKGVLSDYSFPDTICNVESLTISNSTLNYIDNGAFDQNNLHNLLHLEFKNVQLTEITRETLRGLQNLRNFTLINDSSKNLLKCNGFLTQLKYTLHAATIQQQYSEYSIYKINNFFGSNAIYKQLQYVNLNGNNLGLLLDTKSFMNMPNLEYLILANCGLSIIHFDFSVTTLNRLQYLDLSGNRFTTLNSNNFIYGLNCNYINNKSRMLEEEDHSTKLEITTKHIPQAKITTSKTEAAKQQTPPVRTTTSTTTITPETETDTTVPEPTEASETTLPINDEDNKGLMGHIICINAEKETISNTSVSYDVIVKIVDNVNHGSVDITLSRLNLEESWQLIYFANPTHINYVIIEYDTTANDITFTVEFLKCETSYVFCLLIDEILTSPFNCQSHHTLSCDGQIQSWFETHLVVIVSIAIVGILLGVCLGMLAMYGILWLRPTWLHGSKRLIRPTRDSPTMLLIPRSDDREIYEVLRNPLTENGIGEYMIYYKHLEEAKLSLAESNKYNIPPIESAPSAPLYEEQKDIIDKPNTYTYECFELYEEII